MAGAFIVLEGPDGAGKTTQARRLASALEARGVDALVVREPGGTEIGERIREILLDPASEAIDPRAELLLYMASRAQLCREVLGPALAAGRVVIADRFLASSAVYQGLASGLGFEAVLAIGDFATHGVRPDLTVILDLPAELAAERAGGRVAKDRIEGRPLAYHVKVCEGYRRYARLAKEPVAIVDASQDPDSVARELIRHVDPVVLGGMVRR